MDRRRFLGIAGAAATVAAAGPAFAKPKRKPNIVFIVADDLGYRELGCYGQEKIRTPHIDRLAAQGTRLTRHYSGSPVCAPSRCVLMTGRHPGRAYIRSNREHKPEGQEPIPAAAVTVAELLKQQGYTCGAFGKWGLGFPGSDGDPLARGFDRFFGYNCQRHAHSYYPPYLWDDDQRIELNNDPPVPGHARLPKDADPTDPAGYDRYQGTDYGPDRIAGQVMAFIRENRDRPFFCYYPTIIPHLALHVPDDALKPYREKGWEDPPAHARYTPHFTPRAAYAAMITRLDGYVGRVMKLLAELGLEKDTIVVFTSDNGATYLGPMAAFFNSVGELRGLKGSSYEGGLRVPGIVRWPGRVPAGATSDRVTGFEDWMPTLLEFIGAGDAVPEESDGIGFAATLEGNRQAPRPFLYREFAGYGGHQAVWTGRWKGIRTGLQKKKIETELYDLEKDPGETKNVAAAHPDVVGRIEEIMAREHTASKLFPLKALDGKK